MAAGDEKGIQNAKDISGSILAQNVVDYLRDEATLASVSSGKIIEKWVQQPPNLLYLLMLVVIAVRVFIVIGHGFLMLIMKRLL